MSGTRLLFVLMLLAVPVSSFAQASPAIEHFGRKQTFSLFAEYSNDSSHILLGSAEQRKLANFGGAYSLRLFTSHFVDFRYLAEIRPIMVESDPIVHSTVTYTQPNQFTYTVSGAPIFACRTGTNSYSYMIEGVTYASTETDSCGRQWTWGQGFSPAGIKLNFMPRNRLQPVFTGLGGYMFSTKPIPVSDAGSANFTFEFGAGLEYFTTRRGSIRAEYRYHHISNNYTANENPGIDSGLLQITYSFGR
jgi:opacity protein-like surface antigen